MFSITYLIEHDEFITENFSSHAEALGRYTYLKASNLVIAIAPLEKTIIFS